MDYRILEYIKANKSLQYISTHARKEDLLNEHIHHLITKRNNTFQNTLLNYKENPFVSFNVKINNYTCTINGVINSFSQNKYTLLVYINDTLIEELKAAYPTSSLNENTSQIVNSISDALWLRDEKSFIYMNEAFNGLWGRDAEILYKNPEIIIDWVHPDDRSNFEHWVNFSNISESKSYEEHFRVLKPDGDIRWLWSRQYALYDENNKPYRIAGIASDITELKDFEGALHIAKEKAQETDKLKSTFLANISHEIRTPINGIVGFSELITNFELKKETRESYLGIIKKSSNQLLRIIDDIIDFSKIESNQINITIQSFNLNELLKSIHTYFELDLISKEGNSVALQIAAELPDNDAEILSDDTRIKQILNNLIENAIKYTEKGEITFGYTIKQDRIEFFVKDTGIGIPKEKQGVIFKQFRQGDEGNTRKYGGTGLGLAISKGLINLLGGKIWFNSTINKGSTFYFDIPNNSLKKPLATSIKNQHGAYNWKNRIILIVEDEQMNFDFLDAVLEPTGARLISAKTGAQAIKMCDNLNFDLILMDIRLPVLSGIEATKRIKEKNSRIPIIAQTAYSDNNEKEECLLAGCNGFIAKPINKNRLLEMMDKFFTNQDY